MRCTFLPGAILCGSRPRRRRCRAPGCRRLEALSCDAAVTRAERPPKVGDTRLHRERKVVFYVRSVQAGLVGISTSPPGAASSVVRMVSLEDWHAKSAPTCDEPVCERHALRVGPLDFCPIHAAVHAALSRPAQEAR